MAVKINTAPIQTIQVDGRQAAHNARVMHHMGPAAEPKARIPSGMPPKNPPSGEQFGRNARVKDAMGPAVLPDAVKNFTENMKNMERMATRHRPSPGVSKSTNLSI